MLDDGYCLNNTVSVVTGAAGGIGRKIAETLSKAGSKVYAVDIKSDKLNEWTEEWNQNNNYIVSYCLDICNSSSIKEFVKYLHSKEKKVDILVNDAAIISYEYLSMVSIVKMKKMFDVNVFGLIEMMQYISRIMIKNSQGSIINISSMVAVKGVKGQLSYSASKGAVISATKSAAKELAQYNIRVNAIAPGMVATERFNAVMNDNFSEKKSDIPFGRLAHSVEIADLCLFLASYKSAYITGQVIGIDGGLII